MAAPKKKSQVRKNKDRGDRGEYKVRDAIRARGIWCVRAGLMTVEEGERRPDLKVSTLPGSHVRQHIMGEVKTRKGLKWLEEAFEQREIVFQNTDGMEPKVCMTMDLWAEMHRCFHFGDPDAEG